MYAGVRNHAAFDLVVVAASQGGFAAYRRILAALPPEFPAAVIVLQHRAVRQHDVLAKLVARGTRLAVEPAQAGARPRAGAVYVAPADRQLLLTPKGSFTLADPQAPWPLADPLLASAAAAYGARMIAVVVSGRLRDGAVGVQAVKRAGGRVLVQDQATAECFGMPSAAIATGCVDFVLPVEIISSALVALVMAPGAAAWLRVPVPSWAPLATAPAAGDQLVS
jgi:two-component system, chemotaxis family, protein-glutamate methylesterase/glutaminase